MRIYSTLFLFGALCAGSAFAQWPGILGGKVPLLDAHNCYPYDGRWADRIDRALGSGFPIAIEQDLAWYTDPKTGAHRSIISHGKPFTGDEPTLDQYFFNRVKPIVERALKQRDRSRWPMIVLHFDFKDDDPDHIREVWKTLGEHEAWITTAIKTENEASLSPFDIKPLLVLTEESDTQERVFFRDVPMGGRLRVFGSARVNLAFLKGLSRGQRANALVKAAPEQLVSARPTNYRRWWNNSWAVVERGGAAGAGEWTPDRAQRLKSLVDYAHGLGYWIRFYTLDGFAPADDKGWSASYNFSSRARAEQRWKAAVEAGVDLIATDQYEDLAATMHAMGRR